MILNLKKEILKKVTEHYLNSLDFNGIPVNKLVVHFNISLTELNIILKELVNKDKIDLRFGDFHPNAHIQALFEYPKIVLLEIMTEQKIQHSCIYPTKKHLTKIVDKKKYDGKPFSLKLALGFYQLNYEAFDLSILVSLFSSSCFSKGKSFASFVVPSFLSISVVLVSAFPS